MICSVPSEDYKREGVDEILISRLCGEETIKEMAYMNEVYEY